MASWSMINAELADTLEAEQLRRKQPVRQLMRQIVAARAPRGGVCRYCGAPAPGDVVCGAHSDLPHFDPAFAAVVTEPTTGPLPHLSRQRTAAAKEDS